MGTQISGYQEIVFQLMPSAQNKPRVVIDTNLVLSALVFSNGRLSTLRIAWQGKQCQPLVSTVTAAELIRVLAYPKFKLSAADQQELLADYLPYCTTVRMPSKLPAAPKCREKFDLPFLHLAIAGKADYLITGDQDLLCLAEQFTCPIITADQFIKTLNT